VGIINDGRRASGRDLVRELPAARSAPRTPSITSARPETMRIATAARTAPQSAPSRCPTGIAAHGSAADDTIGDSGHLGRCGSNVLSGHVPPANSASAAPAKPERTQRCNAVSRAAPLVDVELEGLAASEC
jgi:hypothetical protein